jgi:hypothetical protein
MDKQFTEEQVLDMVEAEIASRPQLNLPIAPCFTKGLYSRQLFMPAGIEVSSECHKTQHQFIIAFGIVDIYLNGRGWERVVGYKHGITEPGTRRVFRTLTDTMLITFHPIDKELTEHSREAIEALEALVRYEIIEKRDNKYLGQKIQEALS